MQSEQKCDETIQGTDAELCETMLDKLDKIVKLHKTMENLFTAF